MRRFLAKCNLTIQPFMLQVHLSHNSIGDAGADAIFSAIPSPSLSPVPSTPPAGGSSAIPLRSLQPKHRALWLRLEWNCINVAAASAVLQRQRKSRGLLSEVPVKKEDLSRGHEQNLTFKGVFPPPLFAIILD